MSELKRILDGVPYLVAPLRLEFIGGPKDSQSMSIMSDELEIRVSGHKYKLALAKSGDARQDYRYVLVSETLTKKAPRAKEVRQDD